MQIELNLSELRALCELRPGGGAPGSAPATATDGGRGDAGGATAAPDEAEAPGQAPGVEALEQALRLRGSERSWVSASCSLAVDVVPQLRARFLLIVMILSAATLPQFCSTIESGYSSALRLCLGRDKSAMRACSILHATPQENIMVPSRKAAMLGSWHVGSSRQDGTLVCAPSKHESSLDCLVACTRLPPAVSVPLRCLSDTKVQQIDRQLEQDWNVRELSRYILFLSRPSCMYF